MQKDRKPAGEAGVERGDVMMFGHGGMAYGGTGMWLFGIALLAIAGYLLFRVSRSDHDRRSHSVPNGPEEILKQRYARGEIEKEEYDRRLADLRR